MRWRAAVLLSGLIGVLFLGMGMLPAVDAEGEFFRVKQIVSGNGNTAVIKDDGTVWVWGGRFDQAVDGASVDSLSPVPIKHADGSLLSNITAITDISPHSFALSYDGTVWAWGENSYGNLGDGTNDDTLYPVKVKQADGAILTGIIAIESGAGHTIAMRKDGTLWAWGDNGCGQMAIGAVSSKWAVPVTNISGSLLSNITAISLGVVHTVALAKDGTVWTWGNNDYGQLGNGTEYPSNEAIQVTNVDGSIFSDVAAVSADGLRTVALKKDGTVWSWGLNGNLWWQNPTQERQANGSILTNIVAISTGFTNLAALSAHGTVWTWVNRPASEWRIPVKVKETDGKLLSNVVSIVKGLTEEHWLVIKKDGTVWAWGKNDHGQLGDGTTMDRSNAAQVMLAGKIPLIYSGQP